VNYKLTVKLTRKSRNERGILVPYSETWQLNRSAWLMIEASDGDTNYDELAADSMAGYSRMFSQANFSVEIVP